MKRKLIFWGAIFLASFFAIGNSYALEDSAPKSKWYSEKYPDQYMQEWPLNYEEKIPTALSASVAYSQIKAYFEKKEVKNLECDDTSFTVSFAGTGGKFKWLASAYKADLFYTVRILCGDNFVNLGCDDTHLVVYGGQGGKTASFMYHSKGYKAGMGDDKLRKNGHALFSKQIKEISDALYTIGGVEKRGAVSGSEIYSGAPKWLDSDFSYAEASTYLKNVPAVPGIFKSAKANAENSAEAEKSAEQSAINSLSMVFSNKYKLYKLEKNDSASAATSAYSEEYVSVSDIAKKLETYSAPDGTAYVLLFVSDKDMEDYYKSGNYKYIRNNY